MKVYQTNEIKNIALLGNDGSGKTTLTEALLFESGIIKRRGRITAKNTVSDYFPVEQEYGYSVFSTVFHVEWNGKKLNIIDCPGSDDFVGAAMTALNVTDTAILLLNGQYGPEVGTQNHFRYTEKLGKPVIFLVNQLDNEKCDYDMVLEQLQTIYGPKVVPVQYPLATGPNFNSLIDVLLMKKYSWGPEGGAPIIEEIPAEEMEKATELHKALVEAAAEHDEGLMEKFFEQDSLTEDEMREGIRKGLASRGMFPVFCVCAGKDMGVRRLMEFLGNVVPFVDEMPPVHNTRGEVVKPDSNGPTSLYFFKTAVEPHIGDVQYFKVMSGKVHEGDDFTNADRGSKERIAQIYACAGANRIKVEEMVAGDIGCTVKLKDVHTGNTLNGKGSENRFNFIKYPNSKYSRAIKPLNESDTEKMMVALNRMREEDPTWVIDQSKELRQTIVHGQGEFHLRTLKWRLENNEKLQIKFEEPRIPYRETITKAARADYRHKNISLIVLVVVVAIGFIRKVNLGFLSIGVAFALGTFGGMSAKEIVGGFSSSMFVTLVGVTFLFGMASNNGTLDLFSKKVVALVGKRTILIPILMFFLSAFISAIGPGHIAAGILMTTFAMYLAFEMDINPMATSLYAKLGANAGCASVLSLTGVLAKNLSEPLGYSGFGLHLFLSTLLSGFLFTLVVYILYKGYKVKADNPLKLSDIPKFNRDQLLTIAAIVVMVVCCIGFKLDTGLFAFATAAVLVLLGVVDEKKAIKEFRGGRLCLYVELVS